MPTLTLEVIIMDGRMKDATDQPVLGHIEKLVAEEHKLYNQGARREFGQDPKGAHVRSPEVVEDSEG